MTEYQVQLEVFEAIIDGGVRRVSWHVAQGERWLAVAKYPGARSDLADGTPGVVWLRRVQLSLPAGTRLMRLESLPDRGVQRDPLAYLWKPQSRAPERVQRSYFRVGRAGRLVRATSDDH